MAENRAITRTRGAGRPFQPGVSGNPGGRPRNTLGEFIRSATDGGEELGKGVLKIYREAKSPRIKIMAATWLRDSGFGKPINAELEKETERMTVIIRSFQSDNGQTRYEDENGHSINAEQLEGKS